MKELMIGQRRRLPEGCTRQAAGVVSSYPGTPSTEITEFASRVRRGLRRVGPQREGGAGGRRSARRSAGARSLLRHEARGPQRGGRPAVSPPSYTGVNAGLVIGVADDPGMHSSQNEQDSRHYAMAAKLPMLEPADSAGVPGLCQAGLRALREVRHPGASAHCAPGSPTPRAWWRLASAWSAPLKPYEKNRAKVRHDARQRHQAPRRWWRSASQELRGVCRDRRHQPGGDGRHGDRHHHLRHLLPVCEGGLRRQRQRSQARAWSNPLPVERIRDFAAKVDQLYVVEELDRLHREPTAAQSASGSSAARTCFGLLRRAFPEHGAPTGLGRGAPRRLKTWARPCPARPPVMCAGCPHRGLFYALAQAEADRVWATSAATPWARMPPLGAPWTPPSAWALRSPASTASIRPACGGAGEERPWRSSATPPSCTPASPAWSTSPTTSRNSTVIVLDNSITGMTGHQQNPTTGFNAQGRARTEDRPEKLCAGRGHPAGARGGPLRPGGAATSALKEELAADEPSVIISRRPCALLKYVKHKPPLTRGRGQVQRLQGLHEDRLPGHLRMPERQGHRSTTPCAWAAALCEQLCAFDALQAPSRRC